MVAPYKAAAGIVFFFTSHHLFQGKAGFTRAFFFFLNYSQSSKPFKSSGANRLFGADLSVPE